MSSRFCQRSHLSGLLAAFVVCCALGTLGIAQQRNTSGLPPPSPRPPEITIANATGDAAEILKIDQKIEEAVVHGDVAFMDGVLSSDFHYRHGDGWTRGEKTGGMEDDRNAFLKRVKDKEYLVHDLDNVRIEMHGDMALTWGRYVSLFMPPNRNTANPGRLSTIWFERVYAKRNGKWVWVSHRTVHGPTTSPAGIDPSAITPAQSSTYEPGLPRLHVKAEKYPPESKDAAEVIDFEKKIGAAIVSGDTEFFRKYTVDDFSMTHGDGWTRGGWQQAVDNKGSFLAKVANKLYLAHDFDSVRVEMHNDIAITYGRYVAALKGSNPDRAWFAVWFERIYQKRNDNWMYVSHRTVHGASYGPTRESVSEF
jgi:hypothetical protein